MAIKDGKPTVGFRRPNRETGISLKPPNPNESGNENPTIQEEGGISIGDMIMSRGNEKLRKRRHISFLTIFIFMLPWLVVASLIFFGLNQVRSSEPISTGLLSKNRYSCVNKNRDMPPYSHRLSTISSLTYSSMGGENWVQAIFLVQITKLGIITLYSKDDISKIYAAKAFTYGTMGEGHIIGFDALSRRLYGKAYCQLNSSQKGAVSFIFYPLDHERLNVAAVKREVDRAGKMLKRRSAASVS